MEIRIFDVEHGFCAYIIADNGNAMLIDCGHNTYTGFRQSNYLRANGCTGIEQLIISNYDEDHLSDLPNLRRLLPIQLLYRNASISADELQRLKRQSGPIQPGMQALLDMIRTYTINLADLPNPPVFPNIEQTTFCDDYPSFEETNNLSLVTFLHYGDLHVIFPGDLEKAGWLSLLNQEPFRENLRQVNIFIASHHGRESGYCEEVFEFCEPELIIISDESLRYETQETRYRNHASGIPWGDGNRYVLSTRNDGMITIRQNPGENSMVSISR
jgi:beta-lactamase superfamily II metal-dependent hydrolase